jgi:hypothetical protein
VKARAPLDVLRAALEAVPGVTRVVEGWEGQEPGVATCVLDVTGPAVAEWVAGDLAARGLPLMELRSERRDLEALFLDLTGSATARP